MKEMAEEELLDSTLRELGISAIDEYGFMLDLSGDVVIVYNKPVQINHIFEVKLKPKQAEISIKNLGLFMALTGTYPFANFINGDREFQGILSSLQVDEYGEINEAQNFEDNCWYEGFIITDPRWSELEVE